MYRFIFPSLSVLFLFVATFSLSTSTTPSAEAYSIDHVHKLVKEKKRVKAAKKRLKTEIEDDTLTDAQKKELVPKCLDCDLSEYDFSEATNVCYREDADDPETEHCEDLTELDDFDFTGSTMHEANLKSVSLNDTLLWQSNLTGAKFNDAKLNRANLSSSTMTHADFACAEMQDVAIVSAAAAGAMFPGADMRRSKIIFSDLCTTNLTETNMSEARIEAVNMAVAKVVRTNLTDARLYVTMRDATALFTDYWNDPQTQQALRLVKTTEGGSCYAVPSEQNDGSSDDNSNPSSGKTDVSSATLTGVDFSSSDLTGVDFSGRDLSDADFTNTNLTDADLSDADLSGATLVNAVLADADLEDADFTNADLSRADLKGANIEGADFSGAKLKQVDFRDAISDSDTDVLGGPGAHVDARFARHVPGVDILPEGKLQRQLMKTARANWKLQGASFEFADILECICMQDDCMLYQCRANLAD